MTQRRWLITASLVGVAAVALGTILEAHQGTAAVGWFAYAPPPGDDQIHVPFFVTTQNLGAWAIAVGGLMLLAGSLGFKLGSRTARPTPGQTSRDQPGSPAE